MTTKLKKLLTSLLSFSLVLGMLPMGTMAAAAADITSIETEYRKIEESDKSITPPAENSNVARFNTPAPDIAQRSSSDPVESPEPETPAGNVTLTFRYVKPSIDNVSDAPKNIKIKEPITKNAPFAFGTPKYGTRTIPEFYEFHGWYSDDVCQTPMQETDQITKDTTVYGYWTKTPPPTYTLTFTYVTEGVNGAVAPPEGVTVQNAISFEKQYRYDEKLTYGTGDIPASYQFHGWFLEPDFKSLASTSTVVTKDDTLYGYWTKTPSEPPVTPPSPSYSYYRATVRYLALDTNAVLADAYSTDTIREGRSYDVSAQAATAISGYTIDHVEGATSGTLNGNVTVTVWYSAETILENPDVPLADLPEVPPTTPPMPDVSGGVEEVILIDPETPLGNLPQTGIAAETADPASTLGFAALAAFMAMAGLAAALNRKREDAE